MNSINLLFKIILAATILMCDYAIAQGQSVEVGKAVDVRGEAFVTREKKILPLNINSVVEEKDTVKTNRKSFVQVLMKDDTIVKLSQNTTLAFDEFKMRNPEDREATYNLELGKIRALVSKKLGKGHIKLKTRALTLGVRGTEFLVNSYVGKSKYEADIAVIEGVVEINVLNADGTYDETMTIVLNPGQYLNSETAKKVGITRAVQEIPFEVLQRLKENSYAFLENNSMKVIEEKIDDSSSYVPQKEKDEDSTQNNSSNPLDESNEINGVVEENYETVEDGLNGLNDDFVEQTIITAEEELNDILDRTDEIIDITINEPNTSSSGSGGTSSGGGATTTPDTTKAIRQAEREAAKAEREASRVAKAAEREVERAEKAAEREQDKIDRELERELKQNTPKGNGKNK
ncbi:sigma factor regulatory protein, FecR/PupR family [Bacteriovorax sp. BSW11_IV]|uniref:FecR family protein n=1 Tax=Bacteriovorax sp. BSW11_IV TaxID=1353529 RepID=UPI00038A48A7|nr:FecR family protein [Bacteriovorax sp. BSW11_IV]EQC44986.1 sigma factor regulatory protein, FecR/PupR family [Bacteriovorax sp. BSW11_IV]